MSTLTVTVLDVAGDAQVDALVRAYRDTADGPVLEDTKRTNTSGVAALTVANGEYRLHIDPLSSEFTEQWYGGGDRYTAQTFSVSANAALTVVLQLPVDREAAENRPLPLFWVDTTNAHNVLLLFRGEEREAMTDPQSDIYEHVLKGPYLTRVAAEAATP